METSIAVRSNVPSPDEFNLLLTVARNAASSGLYGGVGSEQKIFMVLLAAREMGIPPLQALNGGLWNIQGKIEISARLMNSMIRRAGHSITIKQCDSTKCIMEGKRVDNGDTFTAQFTFDEAARAGLTNRPVWKTYTEDMLYARAMSRLARRLFPDIIGTAYVEGEIRDAKCEVLPVQEVQPEENAKEVAAYLESFLGDYPEAERELMRTYIEKYAIHWKKGILQSLQDYNDREKFLNDFGWWKKKHYPDQNT